MLPWNEIGGQTSSPPHVLFGIPAAVAPDDARGLLRGLRRLFEAQVGGLASAGRGTAAKAKTPSTAGSRPQVRPPDRDALIADLNLMRAWFDPTAKGARVREAVSSIPSIRVELPFEDPLLVRDGGDGRRIVTPEGRALISCLVPAIEEYDRATTIRPYDDENSWIRLRNDDVVECASILLVTYRSWTRRRLDDVVGLLTSETSTLRPAAAGLLLTLLINRNTDPSRALPRPNDRRQLEVISEAIAAPATAYATALTGTDRTGARSLDLYRGWTLGELHRRMGPSLHTGFDSGIYIEPRSVEDAVSRLVEDIRRRPPRLRARVPAALNATVASYERLRPRLAGLGLAFENPAQTRRLLDTLRQAADETDPDVLISADTPSDGLSGPENG
jgi:hypothetical protein